MRRANEKVSILKSTWQFACDEFERVHVLLDKAHVVREMDGRQLTVSERTALLTALPRFYLDDDVKEQARDIGILEAGEEPRTH